MSDDLYPVTLEDFINEVRREIGYRKSVYSRLVSDHRMNQRQADYRVKVMIELLAKLEAERDVKS